MLSCRACGTLFTAGLPTHAEALDYDAYYHACNLRIPPFVEHRLGEIAAEFERYRRLNRWLDVGCGAGALLRAASGLGWEVTGTEISPPAATAVREQGMDVRVGDLPALDLPAAGFDVVSLVEVLEHVPDPDAQLAACARLVRPGGALYVTTPHGRGISARLLRDRWTVVAPPEHLQLFSIPGLRAGLGRAGFAERMLNAHGVDPRALVEGLRSRRGSPVITGCDRVESAYEINESLSSSRVGALAKRLVNSTLSATRLGDGIKLVAELPAR